MWRMFRCTNVHIKQSTTVFEYVVDVARGWKLDTHTILYDFLLPNAFVFVHFILCGLNLLCVCFACERFFIIVFGNCVSPIKFRNQEKLLSIIPPNMEYVWNWIQFMNYLHQTPCSRAVPRMFFSLILTVHWWSCNFLLYRLCPTVLQWYIFSSKSLTNISVIRKCFSQRIDGKLSPIGNGISQ